MNIHLVRLALVLLTLSTSLTSQSVEPASSSSTRSPPLTSRLCKVSGLHVINVAENYSGEIKDLLVDPATGAIRYVLIEPGSLIGNYERVRVIPARLIQVTASPEASGSLRAATRLTKVEIEAAPSIAMGQVLPADLPSRVAAAFEKPSVWDDARVVADLASVDAHSLTRAGELIGARVLTTDDALVGVLSDIVLAPTQLVIAFAIIRTESSLGSREIALPWSCISKTQVEGENGRSLTTAVLLNRFKEAPEYEMKNLAHLSTLEWLTETHKYYSAKPFWPANRDADGARAQPRKKGVEDLLVSAGRLLNTTISNDSGTELGEVGDLLLDGKTGQIEYAVIDVGGFLGIGEDQRVIPWQRITITADLNAVEECRCLTTLTRTELVTAPILGAGPIDSGRIAERVRLATGDIGVPSDSESVHRQLLRLSSMIDIAITDHENAKVGEIGDLMLATRAGCLAYAVIELPDDRTIGLCRTRLAYSHDGGTVRASTTVSASRFEGAPEFDEENWLRMTSASWVDEVSAYYDNDGPKSARSAPGLPVLSDGSFPLHLSGAILEAHMDASDETDFATIRDLVIDEGSGEIRFALINLGQGGDRLDQVRALPWDQVQIEQIRGDESRVKARTRLSASGTREKPSWKPDSAQLLLDLQDRKSLAEGSGLIRLSDFNGVQVRDAKGVSLGTVHEFILSARPGRVAYLAVTLSTAAGSNAVALPWSQLEVDRRSSSVIAFKTSCTSQKLAGAPGYDPRVRATMLGREYLESLNAYYGSAPMRSGPVEGPEDLRDQELRDELNLVAANELLGIVKRNRTGTSVGRLKQALISTKLGRLQFAAIETGIYEGTPQRLCVVSWPYLQIHGSPRWASGCMVRTDLSAEQLRGAPEFNETDSLQDKELEKKVRNALGGGVARNLQDPSTDFICLDEIAGLSVTDPDQVRLGTIEGAMIDPRSQTLAYLIMRLDGARAGRLIALPWPCLEISRDGDGQVTAVNRVDPARLADAALFEKADRRRMTSRAWIEQISKHFDCPPYWQTPNADSDLRAPNAPR